MKFKNISGHKIVISVQGTSKTMSPDEIIMLNYNSMESLGEDRKFLKAMRGVTPVVVVPEIDLYSELEQFTVKELRVISDSIFNTHVKSNLRKSQIIREIESLIDDPESALDAIKSHFKEVDDED